MSHTYIDYGEPTNSPLQYTQAQKMKLYLLSNVNKQLKFIESRNKIYANGLTSEILVIDFLNDFIPTHSAVNIEYRERVAIEFTADFIKDAPRVWCLRSNFPSIPHSHKLDKNTPTLLCLEDEEWAETRRSWTIQLFFKRILWWFEQASLDKLHQPDQSLEALFFESRFSIVIPHGFLDSHSVTEKKLHIKSLVKSFNNGIEQQTLFLNIKKNAVNLIHPIDFLQLNLPAIVHRGTDAMPNNLGVLADQLSSDTSQDIKKLIVDELFDAVISESKSQIDASIVLFVIPMKRDQYSQIEKIQILAVGLGIGLCEIAQKLGIADYEETQKIYTPIILGKESVNDNEWYNLPIENIGIQYSLDAENARQYCGVDAIGPIGVIGGVGALGSQMLLHWIRSGWGQWTACDHDFIRPHNLVRHAAFGEHIGDNKAFVLKSLSLNLMPESDGCVDACPYELMDQKAEPYLRKADLIVDITTTISVPRNLASSEYTARCCSAFITKDGRDAVILMEDSERNHRLDILEAQYYRAILNNTWGKNHIHLGTSQHIGHCRDKSFIIPNELVSIYAAILAKKIRDYCLTNHATISVWSANSDSQILFYDVLISEPVIHVGANGGPSVVFDEALSKKILQMRQEKLPLETGGILVGFHDIPNNSIYIVDALDAPIDSKETIVSFERGIEGMEDLIKGISQRTGGMVEYIGEWHSHPKGVLPKPSSEDIILLKNLALNMELDGKPVVMMIAGDEDITSWVGIIK